MKHIAFAGLFICAGMAASPVFASDADLCNTQLQRLESDMASTYAMSDALKADLTATVGRAKVEKTKGNENSIENCISLTAQALQKLQNSSKGGQ